MKNFNLLRNAALSVFAMLAVSCSDEPIDGAGVSTEAARPKNMPAVMFYALSDEMRLDGYSTANPKSMLSSVSISGLQSGETLMAIDFRPATGQLYGLGSSSRLYVINIETGMAHPLGTAPFTPALSGDLAGFDFNPTVDRIRVVTSSGQNLRLHPETGAVAVVDGNVNGAAGAMIAGSAYTGNVAGSSVTALYNIDVTGRLYKQMPPNDGTQVFVGNINAPISGEGGFDIAPETDWALAIFGQGDNSALYSMDLMTGKAMRMAIYDSGVKYTGIAIQSRPVAYAVNTSNQLMIFNPMNPSVTVIKPITGMADGATVLGIDFRPANGQLYALGSNGQLYGLNLSSGAAMAIGMPISTGLMGTHFGFDFNPVVDRIRIVSDTGQNLRVNPNDGVAIMDGMLNPGSPMVNGAAYTNSYFGTTATSLYVMNNTTLFAQNPPNAGTLTAIGNLGFTAESWTGFDIGGRSNGAFAILTANGSSKVYAINTMTGMATAAGNFPAQVTAMAVGLGF